MIAERVASALHVDIGGVEVEKEIEISSIVIIYTSPDAAPTRHIGYRPSISTDGGMSDRLPRFRTCSKVNRTRRSRIQGNHNPSKSIG